MNLVERAKNILLTPKTEWEVIKGEPLTVVDMFTKYAMILAAIPAVAGFLGHLLIGIHVPLFGNIRWPFGNSLLWAVLTYVLSLAGTYALAMIIDALAPTFGAKKDLVASTKVAVFSYTAAWVGGVFMLIPSLSVLSSLIAIYSLVLLWMGMKSLKEVPEDKMVGYFVVSLIVALVIFFVIGLIVSAVAMGGGLSAGAFGTANL
ncbi:MAG TPA: Yip1 family protein [Candidatus Aminicenantes bacterium]|nr:Yip1 family protein [Candidatus Aminicenantes bacterium]